MLYLGIIFFAISFFFSISSNILLFAGLFLVVAGTAGYILSLKKDKPLK